MRWWAVICAVLVVGACDRGANPEVGERELSFGLVELDGGDVYRRVRAREALVGAAALSAFGPALAHSDYNVRKHAVITLGALGAAALPQIDIVLRDEDPRVRRTAVRALGRVGPAARSRLERLSRGEERGMRRDAIDGLQDLDGGSKRS